MAPDTPTSPLPPDAWPPEPPRGRMPLEQRAKIFMPFDPLKGFADALRRKEQEAEERGAGSRPLHGPTEE